MNDIITVFRMTKGKSGNCHKGGSMKYRIVTNGVKYSIEVRKWYWPFWRLFTFGINEGGGSYYIAEDTKEKANDRFLEIMRENIKWVKA